MVPFYHPPKNITMADETGEIPEQCDKRGPGYKQKPPLEKSIGEMRLENPSEICCLVVKNPS